MKGDHIYYKEGYKYQLVRSYTLQTKVTGHCASTDYIELFANGVMTIKKGYAWDGPSGPTFDTRNSMRGALVHDAFYQLMRLGLIPESCGSLADDELHDICVEDGMWHPRAELWKQMVEIFAAGCAVSGSETEVLEVP
jgi:hypothetical protein